MPNVVKLTAENPDELLNAGAYGAGAIIRLQTATAQSGPFADVTGIGSTPTTPLVAAIRTYTAFDPAGTSSSWYRIRFENVGGTRLSDWSAVFQVGTVGYCSLYDVKQDLELGADITHDELLLDYINEITDFIRAETRREFLPSSGVTLLLDGSDAIDGGRTLLIPRGVRTITSIEVAATTGAAFSAPLPLTDVLTLPREQDLTPGWPATRLRFSDVITGPYSSFPAGYGNVRIVADTGFAALPPRVEGVARRTVVRMFNARQAGQSDMVGSGGEGGMPTVSMFLSKRDRETLDQLRLVRVHRAA